MLWSKKIAYKEDPFASEASLEGAIIEVQEEFFGPTRIYLDIKKRIGAKNHIKNIPDGYLLDLSSTRQPKLYVVENELAAHDPLKHIAAQILEFSLSFETAQHTVKNIIKEGLSQNPAALTKCSEYAAKNGFENVDVLLERMIYGPGKFNALVIIDELSPELEKALITRFQFPVEILTLERYCTESNEHIYKFEPFLNDVVPTQVVNGSTTQRLDPDEIDTIVVPARADGFQEVFINENRWYAIRIHASMIAKIKHIAVYQVAPVSAITYIAPVSKIERWNDSNKYVVYFSAAATKIGPLHLASKGTEAKGKAPQGPRYTTRDRLLSSRSVEEVFDF